MEGFFPCLPLNPLHPLADGEAMAAGFKKQILSSNGTAISYSFNPNGAIGYLDEERSGISGAMIAGCAFDGPHQPKAEYSDGRVVSYGFSASTGRCVSRTDGLGYQTQYTYDQSGAGFVQSSTDKRGYTTTFVNTALGSPLSVTYPDGTVHTFTYDSLDRVLSHTISAPGLPPRVTSYARDAAGRILTVSYPDGTTESWTYNSFGQPTSHTAQDGGVDQYAYDATGRLLTHTDALGAVTTYAYNALDQVSTVTDALGRITSYAYNDRGLLTQTTYPGGATVAFGYDDADNLISATNELGQTWTRTYDEFRHLTSVTDPLGRTVTFGYGNDAANPAACAACNTTDKPTLITLPSGKQTVNVYDKEWHLISTTVAAGTPEAATTTFAYDGNGNVVASRLPENPGSSSVRQVVYTYDSMNRRLTETDPLNRTTSYTYDAFGNIRSAIMPDGTATVTTYDVMNRAVSSKNANNETTSYTYDPAGRAATMTDARNHTHTWTYDLKGQTTRMHYPDGTNEDWTYDAVGNRITAKTRGGQICVSTFDARNREVFLNWNDGVTPDVQRVYDAAGRLVSSSNGVATTSYTYDAANQLLTETQATAGLPGSFTVTYSYTVDGQRQNVTYPAGNVIDYTYNARNQVAAIGADGPPPLVTYAYNADGSLAAKTLENGIQSVFGYDAALQLRSMDHRNDPASLRRFDYTYDLLGRRSTSRLDGGRWDTFGYDDIGQLTSAKYDAVASNGSGALRTTAFAYDKVGNRTSVNVQGIGASTLPDLSGGVDSYGTANAVNQYPNVDGFAQGYDQNGNLTHTKNAGLAWTYTYDSQNRLISASKAGTSLSFAYDSKNRQVRRTVNGVSTFFIWDGWNLIEERDGSANPLQIYVHGAGIDEMLAKIDGNGTVYYQQDALGSTTAITNDAGQIVESYRYDAFGKAKVWVASTGATQGDSSVGNRFMFTGREWIAAASLYDYRNRVYSVELGRFLQTDPIRFLAGDVNLYRYVGNNPVGLTDPSGNCPVCFTAAAGAGLGALLGASFSAYSDFASGRDIDWSKAGRAALKGAVSGGVAGLTLGFGGGAIAGIVGGGAWGGGAGWGCYNDGWERCRTRCLVGDGSSRFL